jgi:hypothetical protein
MARLPRLTSSHRQERAAFGPAAAPAGVGSAPIQLATAGLVVVLGIVLSVQA